MEQTAIKSILFNTEMVRAILDGRKTCTRRIVKDDIPDDAMWGYTAFTPKGYNIDESVIARSVDHYGEEIQATVCMEECAELIQTISKEKRGKSTVIT